MLNASGDEVFVPVGAPSTRDSLHSEPNPVD
jgi:hypothetical protein